MLYRRPAQALALMVALCLAPPAGAELVINEYLSSNINGIHDEDGDYSDWIEIHNSGPEAVDMTGYGLSDNDDEPLKWTFPALVLPADDQLLLFASGKDRRIGAAHWETLIDWGDSWKYRVNHSPTPPDWRETGFNDSGWPGGPSGFGYGDEDDATVVAHCISVSLRKAFQVDDPQAIRYICLHVDYDDAFVVWLNGVEIARANITSPGAPEWNQPADSEREALIYQGGLPETYLLGDVASLFQAGPNVLAIEVHNTSAGSSDMTLIPFFTVGMDEVPPGGGQGVADFIRFLVPCLHTNFRIAAEGETLRLCDSQGGLLDGLDTGQMYVDISRGRVPDGGPEWHFFMEPTPDDPNGEGGYADFAEAPEFSPSGGFYSGTVSVELSVTSPAATIYYTLDGSEPGDTSYLYTEPILIAETIALRARVFEAGYFPSRIVTHSYILNEETTLPIFSLVTDPPNLWDEDIGIYVLGNDYDPDPPHWGANFWQDWERPMHFEFFEPDGAPGFRLDAGVKIHGGWTRMFPQKSLRLMARGGYGTASIQYALFDEKEIDEFRRLILRNAGNDWGRSHMRDALMQRLAAHTGLEYQAYSPTRVYLNGEYWGIHNTRERIDKYFLESNTGVDADSVDLLELNAYPMEGSPEHYWALIWFIETYGVADSANYAHVQTLMDTDNFATYEIFQIFYANTDWPGNNIKFWRPRSADGRWRWILLDLDFGLGLIGNYTHNTLAFALDPAGPNWPNPPWSTFLLRSLLESEEFRNDFINRYADHLNSSFLPSRTTAMTHEIGALIQEELPRHMERWGFPLEEWQFWTDIILDFMQHRPVYARGHVQQQFGLYNLLTLSLDVDPPGGGRVGLTAISVDSTWSGIYFRDVPITLSAVPAPGYVFDGWSDPELPQQETVVILPDGDYAVTALFEENTIPPDVIVINEINYHSADGFETEDWVELYNNGDAPVDLTGWQFRDERDDHIFDLPEGFVLEVDAFVVLCQDTTVFRTFFPDAGPILGNLGFGFGGGGELLRLFDAGGELYDWVEYDDAPPWPPEPDGGGPTLELINPARDNTLAENWAASTGHGTPGEINSAWESGAAPGVGERPLVLALGGAFPNPAGLRMNIEFSLDRARKVQLGAYDVTGRRVALLAAGRHEAGVHRLDWSGLDDAGRPLSSGVYLLRMESEGFVASRKLLMIR
jgi:hypothetical protein